MAVAARLRPVLRASGGTPDLPLQLREHRPRGPQDVHPGPRAWALYHLAPATWARGAKQTNVRLRSQGEAGAEHPPLSGVSGAGEAQPRGRLAGQGSFEAWGENPGVVAEWTWVLH